MQFLCGFPRNHFGASALTNISVSPPFAASCHATMPSQQQFVHPASLNLDNQKKIVYLRDVRKLSWEKIAAQVGNLQAVRDDSGPIGMIWGR